jgi:molybdate transport system substrate-binding protein
VVGQRRSGPAGRTFPLAMAAALGLATVGCGGAEKPPPAASGPLRVAAASDLREALPVLAARFTEKTGVAVVPTFGASGQLVEQIRAGAPFDLFLSANVKFVQDLAQAGLIRPSSVKPYARGTLVLAVHHEAGGAIETLADLRKAEVKKIALANPALAPYGIAGKQALERAGLWEDVRPKIVQAESVSQALEYVRTGNAEAGFVGRSIVGGRQVRVLVVDPALYDPIVQGMGIVASPRTETAEAFHAFILGPEGRKILADHGLNAP